MNIRGDEQFWKHDEISAILGSLAYQATGFRYCSFTIQYNRLSLPFLANNADIEPGDLLVTSGLGGAFPSGYPVAVVEKVTRLPQEPFAEVSATPAAALDQVREVMLIWTRKQDEGTGDE